MITLQLHFFISSLKPLDCLRSMCVGKAVAARFPFPPLPFSSCTMLKGSHMLVWIKAWGTEHTGHISIPALADPVPSWVVQETFCQLQDTPEFSTESSTISIWCLGVNEALEECQLIFFFPAFLWQCDIFPSLQSSLPSRGVAGPVLEHIWLLLPQPATMYCLQWLLPVLLIPKPLNPALWFSHSMFMGFYLLSFLLERKPCTICALVFLAALFLICYSCWGNCFLYHCTGSQLPESAHDPNIVGT